MAMVDESARMMAAANPGLQSIDSDEDKCDTCKLIITQVATMLRNPVRADTVSILLESTKLFLCPKCCVFHEATLQSAEWIG